MDTSGQQQQTGLERRNHHYHTPQTRNNCDSFYFDACSQRAQLSGRAGVLHHEIGCS